jgi:hypothetical protein
LSQISLRLKIFFNKIKKKSFKPLQKRRIRISLNLRQKLRTSEMISKLKILKSNSFCLKMENLKGKMNKSQISISTSKIYSNSWVPFVTVTIMIILCKALLTP